MLILLTFLLLVSSITDMYTTTMDVLSVVLTKHDQEIANYRPCHPTSGGI